MNEANARKREPGEMQMVVAINIAAVGFERNESLRQPAAIAAAGSPRATAESGAGCPRLNSVQLLAASATAVPSASAVVVELTRVPRQ